MIARICIGKKAGVPDPEAEKSRQQIEDSRFGGQIKLISAGKYFEIKLAEGDENKAKAQTEGMSSDPLAKTDIESYRFELVP